MLVLGCWSSTCGSALRSRACPAGCGARATGCGRVSLPQGAVIGLGVALVLSFVAGPLGDSGAALSPAPSACGRAGRPRRHPCRHGRQQRPAASSSSPLYVAALRLRLFRSSSSPLIGVAENFFNFRARRFRRARRPQPDHRQRRQHHGSHPPRAHRPARPDGRRGKRPRRLCPQFPPAARQGAARHRGQRKRFERERSSSRRATSSASSEAEGVAASSTARPSSSSARPARPASSTARSRPRHCRGAWRPAASRSARSQVGAQPADQDHRPARRCAIALHPEVEAKVTVNVARSAGRGGAPGPRRGSDRRPGTAEPRKPSGRGNAELRREAEAGSPAEAQTLRRTKDLRRREIRITICPDLSQPDPARKQSG